MNQEMGEIDMSRYYGEFSELDEVELNEETKSEGCMDSTLR